MRGTGLDESSRRFGSWAITRAIGHGGMASVYEARHVRLGKRVAVKVLEERIARDARGAARFVREGRAAAAIRHPNVVEVFEAGEEGDRAYLVMELLEGEDLARKLARDGRLSACEAVDLVIPIACGVAAAHEAGVVHRDIKPGNVLLARERAGIRPVVVDFGISKERDGDALTATEALLGTLDYMAPEQARSAKDATPASDQYSLAVVLYECLTGSRPFRGDSAYALMHAIVTEPVIAPRELAPEMPAELEDIVLRAMDRHPAARFPDMRAFARALLPFASEEIARAASRELDSGEAPPRPSTREEHEPAVTEPGSVGGVTAPPRKRLAIVAPAVAAGIAIAAASIWIRVRAGETPTPASSHDDGGLATSAASAIQETSVVAPASAEIPQEAPSAAPPAPPAVTGAAPHASDKPKLPIASARKPTPSLASPPPKSSPSAPKIVGNNGAPILE